MPKRPLKLVVRIPPYHTPRNAWRKQLHQAIDEQLKKTPIAYRPSDKLELRARIYMDPTSLRFHDVDNRLKDIMDALQGRAGGAGKRRSMKPIIHNDSQIYRVTIEKKLPPPQSHGQGHLLVRRLRTK